MPRIGRGEWVRAILLAILVVAIAHVPYYVGFQHGPAGRVFSGLVLNELDGNTYLAVIQQGMQGKWQFHLLYTSEEHQGSLLYFFYILLGHLARELGISAVGIYHLARLFFGFLLLMAEFAFIAVMLALPSARWIAYLLSSCASGLGWLVMIVSGSTAIQNFSPIDFWLIDAYTFFTILHAPHLCLALTLLLLLFVFFLLFARAGHGRRALAVWLLAALAALGLAMLSPYTLLIAGLVLGAYWVVLAFFRRAVQNTRREAAGLVGLGLLLALPLGAYYLTVQADPVLRTFAAQDITLSPPPWFYVLGYGLLFLCALAGAARLLRWRSEKSLFVLTWVVVIALALYFPFNLQRRLILGLQVPLGVLAAVGLTRYILPAVRRSRLAGSLQHACGYPPQRLRTFVLNLIVMLTLPSVIYLWVSAVAAAAGGHPDLFYHDDEVAAIDWLGQHSSEADVILSSYRTGNYIPARTGRRVFLGHWDETIDYERKSRQVAAFFQTETADSVRLDLLRQNSISFVFWGWRERRLGQFQPDAAAYLQKVYERTGTAVYRVQTVTPNQTDMTSFRSLGKFLVEDYNHTYTTEDGDRVVQRNRCSAHFQRAG